VKTLPGKGIELQILQVSASVTANWNYREHAWPHISDHGSADIAISQVSIVADIGFGANGAGEPTCNVLASAVGIGHFDIHLHGGASWLYNIIVDLFKSNIQHSIADGIRNAINGAINNNLNKVISTLPVKQNIQNLLLADYSLVDSPRFADYLVLDCKGEFFDLKNPQEAPFAPQQIPDVQNTNVMVQFTIGQYVADTAGFSLWKSGVLVFNINDSMIPPESPIRFNTDSFKYIIPQLYNAYPSKFMQATFDPIASPIITFLSNGTVEIFTQFEMSTFVIVNNTIPHVFTLGINLTTEGNIHMNGSLIIVNLYSADIGMWLLKTDIGNFDISPLYNIAYLALSELIPFANLYLNKGIPLPNIPGVTFLNPYIGYGSGYIFVNTDVNYNPGK